MEETLNDVLKKKSTNISINKDRYKKILNDIILEIKDNKKEFKRVNDIDKNIYDTNIDIEKLVNIIKNSQEKELILNKNSKNILISYYGSPYITLELCIEAIKTNNKLILAIEDYMLGINKLIVNIVQNILNDYRIENKIFIFNLLDKNVIAQNAEIDKVICIGNKNTFELYKKIQINNLIYYPFNNIDLYCDTDELEELQEMIYQYAEKNFIDLEIYDEFENINRAVEYLNKYGNKFCTVLLTKSKENEEIFRNNIISKYIFVNENPFGKYEFNIDKYIKI